MEGLLHIDSTSKKWRAVSEGVEMLVLRVEPGEVRALLRFAPGCGYQRHLHPQGEEVYVIDGVYVDEGVEYGAGSYLYYPPGSNHAPTSTTGCTILSLAPVVPENL